MAGVSSSIIKGDDVSLITITVWRHPDQEKAEVHTETKELGKITGKPKNAIFCHHMFLLPYDEEMNADITYLGVTVAHIQYSQGEIEISKIDNSKELKFAVFAPAKQRFL